MRTYYSSELGKWCIEKQWPKCLIINYLWEYSKLVQFKVIQIIFTCINLKLPVRIKAAANYDHSVKMYAIGNSGFYRVKSGWYFLHQAKTIAFFSTLKTTSDKCYSHK